MKSLEMLKSESSQRRLYRVHINQFEYVQWHVSDMTRRMPGINWSDCCKVVRGTPAKDPYEMDLKHMIHWGKADARIIEDAFGVTLPSCVHEFYSEVQECVLNWKHSYQILRPEQVVAWEKFHRECENADELPVHLIRFCKLERTGDSIAFRKHTRTGRWHIKYAAYWETTREMQSPESDEYNLADDLDEWLVGLNEHDGILDPDDRQDQDMERLS